MEISGCHVLNWSLTLMDPLLGLNKLFTSLQALTHTIPPLSEGSILVNYRASF